MAYVTTAELKTYLGIAVATDDTLLGVFLNVAQRIVDGDHGRSFEAATATRYYRQNDLMGLPGIGEGGRVLMLRRDLISVTTLTNGDATALTSADYWLEPRNDGPPYHWIRLKQATGKWWNFTTDGEITVVGSWGYATTPPTEIQQMTKRVAAWLYRQKDAQAFDQTTFTEAGILRVKHALPRDIYELSPWLVAPWRKAVA